MALEKYLPQNEEEMKKMKFTDEPGMLNGATPMTGVTPAWMPREREDLLAQLQAREGPEGLERRRVDEEGMDSWVPVGGGLESFERAEYKPLEYRGAFDRDQATYNQLLQGQLPKGWVPLTNDIPTFEDWIAAQGPGYMPRGDNTPYYEYFKAHFQLPTTQGDMFSMLPVLAGGMLTGGLVAPAAWGAMGAGAFGGALSGAGGAAMQGGDIGDILRAAGTGAAIGGVSAGAGQYAGGAFTNPTIAQIVAQATRAATAAGLSGGDVNRVIEAALSGALTGAAAPSAENNIADIEDAELGQAMARASAQDELDRFMSSYTNTMRLPPPRPAELPPLASPESVSAFLGRVPEATPGTILMVGGQPVDIGALAIEEPVLGEETAPTGEAAPVEEGAAEPTPAAPKESSVDFKKAAEYVKTGKKIYDLYQQLTGGSGRVPGFDLPQRGADMTDEQYRAIVGERAVEYMGLDAERMRQKGLVPGTPEYLEYIMAQADKLIEQISGEDPSTLAGESADELKAAFRNLSEQEMEQLARALYTRGTLGMVTTSPEGVDPFTGISEELGMLPGEFVAGDIAAAQRGYARSLERLARLPGAEAREDLRGLLGRNIDIFGLQAQADQKSIQRSLIEKAQQEMRRRGIPRDRIWDQNSDFWRDIMEQLSPEEYEYLLRLIQGVA